MAKNPAYEGYSECLHLCTKARMDDFYIAPARFKEDQFSIKIYGPERDVYFTTTTADIVSCFNQANIWLQGFLSGRDHG
jgi:hypothetical protein